MGDTYQRGQSFVKYLNVLRQNGSVPTFPGDYPAPTYEILFKNGAFSVLVPDTSMTQGLDNAWYFTYVVDEDATLGTYLIKFKTTLDGVPIEATEEFIVEEVSVVEPVGPGVGEFAIIDEVQNDAMDDLSGVDVFVFLPSDTETPIAHVVTDVAGQFTVYLDEGSYVLLFNKSGFISETHGLTVDSMGGHTFTGD